MNESGCKYHDLTKDKLQIKSQMQEAYVNGYWNEVIAFMGGLFNATFKTNPCLEREILTGITRVSNASLCESSESIFSDLNNLEVCIQPP